MWGARTPMNNMTCQSAQQLFQEMLDQRQATALEPSVTEHLTTCEECHAWQLLLGYQPERWTHGDLRADFARQVVQRYQHERRRQRWLRGGSILTMAASLLIAGFVWFSSRPAPFTPLKGNSSELAQLKSRELLTNMRNEFAQLQTQALLIQPPHWTIPASLTDWEFNEYGDALAVSMPAIKTIGNSLQGAIEPYELPAKTAYSKVKAVIDDPEIKKWVSRFN